MTHWRWIAQRVWVLGGVMLLAAPAPGWGQVVEKRERVTGPGGRSAERTIRTERGPGYIDRQVDISRSTGAHLSRETVVRTGPGGRPWHGPPPRPPVHHGPGPAFGAGLIAAPFLSLSFGSPPPPPPPPPVVIVPEPIYAYPAPPVVIAAPHPPAYVAVPEPVEVPVQVAVPAPPAAPAFDPFNDAYGRLKSYHANSRRDGSLTLGHLGDNRAVPALIERLERDGDRDVRVAAAWALGEIGDSRSAMPLERAALYDKKTEVRTAANDAYRRLPRPGQAPPPQQGQAPPPMQGQSPGQWQGQGPAQGPGGPAGLEPTPTSAREVLDPGPPIAPNRPMAVPDDGPDLDAPAGSPRPGRSS